MSSDQLNIVRNIQLPQGGTLEVAMTQQFVDRVRTHFNIDTEQSVDDDHVRMYLWGSFNAAISKVENNVVIPTTESVAPVVKRIRRTRRRRKTNA